jgi:hypothetical protein
MLFNTHSNLIGQHAFLSASSYSWINYTDEKLDARFVAAMAAKRGTELHNFASEAIRLGIKLPDTKTTLNMYVNDAIGFRMSAERVLYYSDNCFGTADAIGLRKNVLRIFDLKTGISQTSEHQLEVYAALFCLEYNFIPFELEFDLRIYQRDEVREYEGDPDVIIHIMEKIKAFDKRITAMRLEALR